MVNEAGDNFETNMAEATRKGLQNFGKYMDEMKGYYNAAKDAGDSESMRYYAE
jgi:hypothetical protein